MELTPIFPSCTIHLIESDFQVHYCELNMTNRRYGVSSAVSKKDVSVWFCDECTLYHLKAGRMVLTFEKDEFSEFVNETWNCYYERENSVKALQGS